MICLSLQKPDAICAELKMCTTVVAAKQKSMLPKKVQKEQVYFDNDGY